MIDYSGYVNMEARIYKGLSNKEVKKRLCPEARRRVKIKYIINKICDSFRINPLFDRKNWDKWL